MPGSDSPTPQELASLFGDDDFSDDFADEVEPDDDELEEIENDLQEELNTDDLSELLGSGDGAGGTPDDDEEVGEVTITDPDADDFDLGEFLDVEEDDFDDTGAVDGQTSLMRDSEKVKELHQVMRQHGYGNDARRSEITNLLDQIESLENTKSEVSFAQADNIGAFIDMEGWKIDGSPSFRQFFLHSDWRPCDKSAAYRYRQVSMFMDEFPIGEESFDDQFYEDLNVDRFEVTDEEGNIDEARTRSANNLRRRLNFTDVDKIASAYNNGRIDNAKARELLKASLEKSPQEFKEELDKENKGRENTITDELTDRGFVGPTFIVNAQNPEKAAAELRSFADRIEDGENFVDQVVSSEQSDGVEKIGSKPVSFVELQDGTLMVDI